MIVPRASPPPESRDWQYSNTTPWNYAIDPLTLKYKSDLYTKLKLPVFAPDNPPGYIEAKACLINWPLFLESVPNVAPMGADRRCFGNKTETVRLVPYGSAKIHMADLPTLDLSSIAAS